MRYNKKKLARHEAAHFVAGWAILCPAFYVDITPHARRQCDNDQTMEIRGVTFGQDGCPSPFEHIITNLAGPVADHWKQDGDQMLEAERDNISRAIESISSGTPLDADDGDWDSALRWLSLQGFDVTDPAQARKGMLLFIEAVREILNLCAKEWDEATAYLVAHGRIGFNGERPDCGEGADAFFAHWGYEPPKAVLECVSKYRGIATLAEIAEGNHGAQKSAMRELAKAAK